MRFWTAQYRYPGPNRLDITVKGKDTLGRYFAPTWRMVQELKQGKRTEEEYIQQYHKHICKLFTERPNIIQTILNYDELVLVCFCPYKTFCHRLLLADYLVQLGATFMGEITDFSTWTKKPEVIDSFKGAYHWLSNFAPCTFTHQGLTYKSVEHLYQAHKVTPEAIIKIPHPTNQNSKIQVNAREYLATCGNPKKAVHKYKIKPPKTWFEGLREEVMHTGLEYKFIANNEYKQLLLSTGEALLIEGNIWHDNYWGNCTCLTNPEATFKKETCKNPGKNMLGKMIMEIRSLLK